MRIINIFVMIYCFYIIADYWLQWQKKTWIACFSLRMIKEPFATFFVQFATRYKNLKENAVWCTHKEGIETYSSCTGSRLRFASSSHLTQSAELIFRMIEQRIQSFANEGGNGMHSFIRKFALWLFNYGKVNAGMASIRGAYEVPVPQCLSSKHK